MNQWYAVSCYLGHQGAGKAIETTNYVFCGNPVSAYLTYRRMPAVKRNRIPNIRPLTEQEALDLEQRIIDTPKVTLLQAKKDGFYGTRR